jgi:hypothetical protein
MNAMNNGSLLDQLIAAARKSAELKLAPAPAVDPAYEAYKVELAAADAARPVCSRCDGMGYLRGYEHVAGGICFRCGGHKHEAWQPLSYGEWLVDRANALGLGGFPVYHAE